MKNGDIGLSQYLVHKSVASYAVGSLMRPIIEFDYQFRPHHLCVTYHKVHVLAADTIEKVHPSLRALGEEDQIGQTYFRKDEIAFRDSLGKDIVICSLPFREEVIFSAIR